MCGGGHGPSAQGRRGSPGRTGERAGRAAAAAPAIPAAGGEPAPARVQGTNRPQEPSATRSDMSHAAITRNAGRIRPRQNVPFGQLEPADNPSHWWLASVLSVMCEPPLVAQISDVIAVCEPPLSLAGGDPPARPVVPDAGGAMCEPSLMAP